MDMQHHTVHGYHQSCVSLKRLVCVCSVAIVAMETMNGLEITDGGILASRVIGPINYSGIRSGLGVGGGADCEQVNN
jgi:hypothetical protein